MDSVLKRRLVGAAVIIALAVIFVPMLLESPDSSNPVKSDIKIPKKPSYDIPNRLESQVVDGGGQQVSPTRETSTIVINPDSPLIRQFPAGGGGGRTTDVSEQKTDIPVVAPPAKKAPAVVVETSTKPNPPLKKPEKKVTPAKPEKSTLSGSGFVAQVGSFSQKQNAEVLADKLMAAGYPAFVESARAGSNMVHRVKLGPVNTRDKAEGLLDKVRQKEGLGGIVVSYP